ncbi:MAG: hypothetical protein ACKPJJ_05185, partial [Planctomycetaceae bacterium]
MKGPGTGQHFVEDDPEREQVTAIVDAMVLCPGLFGAEVVGLWQSRGAVEQQLRGVGFDNNAGRTECQEDKAVG